jgi:hypothetical protein
VSKIIKQFFEAMKPKGRPGRLPTVSACPYCGAHMSKSDHAKQGAGCKTTFKDAPPQAAEFAQDPGGAYNKDGTFPQT